MLMPSILIEYIVCLLIHDYRSALLAFSTLQYIYYTVFIVVNYGTSRSYWYYILGSTYR